MWYVLALAEGGRGIEKTEDFLRKLRRQKLIWARGHSASHSLLIAGEYDIMGENFLIVYRTEDIILQMAETNIIQRFTQLLGLAPE